MKKLVRALLFAATAAAQPVVTGISPNTSGTAGGTIVTITGSGFSMWPNSPTTPPAVGFGGRYVNKDDVTLVDASTLRVKVPAHLPMTVDIIVNQYNGWTRLPEAFTFTGSFEEGFDRALLPLFTGEIDGAFGSVFVTDFRLANSSATEAALVYGLTRHCPVTCLFGNPVTTPYEIEPGSSVTRGALDFTGTPGLFLYIPKSSPRIEANLRVYDASRDALNFGTEMPVVYHDDFTFEPFKLLGVPLDPRFRNTLRLYADRETYAEVKIGDTSHLVILGFGRYLLEPAYAQFSDFPTGSGTVDVTIIPSTLVVPGVEPAKVWGFVSVTNNDTQLITTITPQR